MKIAVSGKGGVGKTTVAAAVARALSRGGHRVTVVDADPVANLAGTLGYRGASIVPLLELRALIAERVGTIDGVGAYLRMNPRVDDLPKDVGVDVEGIRLLVMGGIERARGGCACPQNVLVRELVRHLVLAPGEDLVVDLEAGIEHLGRGTAEAVDAMLVVVEPGWASLATAAQIEMLARDLGVRRVLLVANKVAGPADEEFIRAHVQDRPVWAVLPFDAGLEQEARDGTCDPGRPFHRGVEDFVARLNVRQNGG
jgi:CO dehydrogenase maturation factor